MAAGRMYQKIRDRISRAKKIVVVGGGPTGVELAGELCEFFPEISTTSSTLGIALCTRTMVGKDQVLKTTTTDKIKVRLKRWDVSKPPTNASSSTVEENRAFRRRRRWRRRQLNGCQGNGDVHAGPHRRPEGRVSRTFPVDLPLLHWNNCNSDVYTNVFKVEKGTALHAMSISDAALPMTLAQLQQCTLLVTAA